MDEPKDFPKYFELFTAVDARPSNVEDACSFIEQLDPEQRYTVTIREGLEKRSEAANALAHCWLKIIWQAQGESYPKRIMWGVMKQMLLLPIKLSWPDPEIVAEAEIELQIIDMHCVSNQRVYGFDTLWESKADLACRYVRSKDMPIKLFTEWLEGWVAHWEPKGVPLPVITPEDCYALGRDRVRSYG